MVYSTRKFRFVEEGMLDNTGFDLWADGYDKAVGISDDENAYPFAGYKKVLGGIFHAVMQKQNASSRSYLQLPL